MSGYRSWLPGRYHRAPAFYPIYTRSMHVSINTRHTHVCAQRHRYVRSYVESRAHIHALTHPPLKDARRTFMCMSAVSVVYERAALPKSFWEKSFPFFRPQTSSCHVREILPDRSRTFRLSRVLARHKSLNRFSQGCNSFFNAAIFLSKHM